MTPEQLAKAVLRRLVSEARVTCSLPLDAALTRAELDHDGQGVLSDDEMEALDAAIDALLEDDQ